MHRSTGYPPRPWPGAVIANTAITAGPNTFLTAGNDKLITYQG